MVYTIHFSGTRQLQLGEVLGGIFRQHISNMEYGRRSIRFIGAYSVGRNVFDLYVMIVFGVAGYFLRKWRYEPAPLVLAFVLGPMLEQNLRQALLISEGSLATFLTRPLSAISLGIALLLLLSALIPSFQSKRKSMISEG